MKKYILILLVSLLTASVANAQSVGTLVDQSVGTSVDQSVGTSVDSLVGTSVELSLDDCLEMAQTGTSAIMNARLDVTAARHQKMEAFTEYFPKVSLSAIGFHTLDPLVNLTMTDLLGTSDAAHNVNNLWNNIANQYGFNTNLTGIEHCYFAAATLMQPIYAGGRIVTGNRLANLGVRAASLKSDLVNKEQSELIESKFWQIISLEEKKTTLAHAEEYVNSILNNVESAVNAGLALDTDLMMVHKELNKLKVQKTRLYSGLRIAKMDLLNTIGMEYSVLGLDPESEIPCLDSISLMGSLDTLAAPSDYYMDESQIAMSTQESELLDLSVDAARLEKKMEVGKSLPSVGVGLAYGYFKTVGEGQWNGLAFASVNIPLTSWWGTSHRMKRYQVKVDKAINDRNYLQSQLVVKAHMLWEEVRATWEELKIAEEALDMYQLTVFRLQSRYNAGDATVTDLLQSTNDLRLAQDAIADARIAYRTAVNKYLHMSRR